MLFLILYLLAYEDATDSVPKRRHIKFRRRGITQKKTYNNRYAVALPRSANFVRTYITAKA